jgi:serine-type D-Ala-D-Ala carboxypeptidase
LARADTIFDLASLTKVLSTTSLVMRLVEQGLLGLDDPVGDHLQSWRGADRAHVTIRDLLSHAGGLPGHRRYYETLPGQLRESPPAAPPPSSGPGRTRGSRPAVREAYERAIVVEPLEYEPRARAIYSDLGFMLLGFILEQGSSLVDRFDALRDRIAPAGELQFRPPALWRSRTAPTEIDWWRGRLLRGEVHDENTWALGGAAGQAGLFGTAAAVGHVARHLLQVLDGRQGIFTRQTVETFVARRGDVPGSRALGWDTMLPTSSCGTRMSARAFGHTGFTGTSLWIDPERDVYVVLLTNRVHPTRSNIAVQAVRRAFHDAVIDELDRGAKGADGAGGAKG